jgi:dTDP-glucose 4,6-dehydratase
MRILVTGGLGFIGGNLIRHLLTRHKDYEILNIDNLSTGSNMASLSDLQSDKRYRFIKGDIRNKRLIKTLIRDVEAVANVAAETHVDRSITDPAAFYDANTIGALTILEAIRHVNPSCRLLQVSTDEVYGDIVKGSFNESAPLRPSSPYSASKAAADLATLAHHRTYGLNTVVTRCTNNFGPYQFPEKLIPKTIVRAVLDLPIPIYGAGTNVRDWIRVQDHCSALEAALIKGESGQVYNVSSKNEFTNLEVVTRILRIMNKPQTLVAHVEDRPGHDIRYSLDSTRIGHELGWAPALGFEPALKETVDWYLRHEDWWRPIATDEVLCQVPWRKKAT